MGAILQGKHEEKVKTNNLTILQRKKQTTKKSLQGQSLKNGAHKGRPPAEGYLRAAKRRSAHKTSSQTLACWNGE